MRREPDFNRDRMEGQMNPEERELLYRLVLENEPHICVESGTCLGGGSTYFVASALYNLDAGGVLHTVEIFDEFFDRAKKLYRNDLAYLNPFVKFHRGNTLDTLKYLAITLPKIDFAVLDGGACPVKILYDYCLLRDSIPVGGIACFHDWDSKKGTLIKPLMEADEDWRLIEKQIELAAWRRIDDTHGRS